MKRTNALIAVLFMSLLASPLIAAESKSEALYKQAYRVETVDRDPAKAIELYKNVLGEDGDRGEMTAKAHLRIGLCYEKLNETAKAKASYQDIVDMSEAPQATLQQAREHLQRLEPPVTSVAAVQAQPASTFERGLLELSFLGGQSVSGVYYGPFDMRQENSPLYQFSLMYEVTKWVSFGLEASYPFKHDSQHESNRTERHIFQLTPELQFGGWMGKIKPYFTLGGGWYRVSDDIDYDIYDPATAMTQTFTGSDNRNLGGINAGFGCLFRAGKHFALGPDLRFHNIFDAGENYWYGAGTLRLALLF